MALVLTLAAGWRFFTVLTPSMGVTAPVGTLVVSHPADRYQVGDVVSYDNTKGRVYTHRITEVLTDGSFVTKGDLNDAPDPFTVRPAQVVGRAVWLLPGWGWLLKGLPWLIMGFLVVHLASLFLRLREPWPWVVRITGATFVVALVAVWLRPWVGLDMLGFSPAAAGVDMHVVNVGLFPLDVLGSRISSGEDVVVHVTNQNAAGFYELTPGLALTWWQQLLVWLVCLVPLGTALLIRSEPEPSIDPTAAGNAGRETDRKRVQRLVLIGGICLAVVAGVGVVTLTATHSALSAAVQNTTNRVGARVTCRGAVTNPGSANTVWAFALEPTGTTAKTEVDLSGNSNAGSYLVPPVKYATTPLGCTQDQPQSAVTFSGNQCVGSSAPSQPNVQTFSVEAWFRTTSTVANGKIIGLGAAQYSPLKPDGTTETTYDRHVYVDNLGRVVFGTYNGGYQTIASGSGFNDGRWHNMIATFSAGTGMRLYLDGALAASRSTYTVAENTTGYWKLGCGNLSGWPNGAGGTYAGPSYFTGQIQYAAVYQTVLTAPQVQAHYQAGLA